MEKGAHLFEITGYSFKKGMGVGKFVRSAIFTVGGYDWSIRFYPEATPDSPKGCMRITLELMSSNAEVRTFFDFGLVKHDSGQLGRSFTPHTMTFSSQTSVGVAPVGFGYGYRPPIPGPAPFPCTCYPPHLQCRV
jgi:speckle-type POZ protein